MQLKLNPTFVLLQLDFLSYIGTFLLYNGGALFGKCTNQTPFSLSNAEKEMATFISGYIKDFSAFAHDHFYLYNVVKEQRVTVYQ